MNEQTIPHTAGYGKPPLASRFQKGRSGNPAGSSKRVRSRCAPPNPAHRPSDDLILAEAYRPVAIEENGKTVRLPAIQAAMRALTIAAMEGSNPAARNLADLVRTVEARKSLEQWETLRNAYHYRRDAQAELDRRQAKRITGLPDPLPHPDDVHIDLRTGEVRFDGPFDAREKRAHDQRLADRDTCQAEVSRYAALWREAGSEAEKAQLLQQWHLAQWLFDQLNDLVPERCKASLDDRWVAGDASSEGETLDGLMR